MDIPNTGAIFTLGKSYLAENTQSYFYIKNDPIQKVVTGPFQSAVICDSGRLFVWGENHLGQLGISNSNNNNKTKVKNEPPNDSNRRENGDVWNSSDNAEGIITKPTCVKSLKNLGLKIADIAFGQDWSVILTHSNELFFTGRNIFPSNECKEISKHFMRTTVVNNDNQKEPQLTAATPSSPSTTNQLTCEIVYKPFKLEDFDACLSASEDTENYVNILAGNHHFTVLTSFGRLIGWGSNEFHQLGDATHRTISKPHEMIFHSPVQQCVCGPESTLVLTEDDHLYLTGRLNEFEFVQFTELQKNLSPTEQIIFIYISQANEIFIVTNIGSIYRSYESQRNRNLIFQRYYDYDSEEYGPIWKLLKGDSFCAVLTKANKFYTTFSESGHHLKTFREITKFKNLRILDIALGVQHVLVHGIPRTSNQITLTSLNLKYPYMKFNNNNNNYSISNNSYINQQNESVHQVQKTFLNNGIENTSTIMERLQKTSNKFENMPDEAIMATVSGSLSNKNNKDYKINSKDELNNNNTSELELSPTDSLSSRKSICTIKPLLKDAPNLTTIGNLSEEAERPSTTTISKLTPLFPTATMTDENLQDTSPAILEENKKNLRKIVGNEFSHTNGSSNIDQRLEEEGEEEDEQLTVEISETTDPLNNILIVNEIRFINNGVDVTASVKKQRYTNSLDKNSKNDENEIEYNDNMAINSAINNDPAINLDIDVMDERTMFNVQSPQKPGNMSEMSMSLISSIDNRRAIIDSNNSLDESNRSPTKTSQNSPEENKNPDLSRVNRVKDSIEAVALKAVTGARGAVGTVTENGAKVTDNARHIIESTGANLNRATQEAKDVMSSALRKIADDTKNVANTFSNKLSTGANTAKSTIASILPHKKNRIDVDEDSKEKKENMKETENNEIQTEKLKDEKVEDIKENTKSKSYDTIDGKPFSKKAMNVVSSNGHEDDERTTASINSAHTPIIDETNNNQMDPVMETSTIIQSEEDNSQKIKSNNLTEQVNDSISDTNHANDAANEILDAVNETARKPNKLNRFFKEMRIIPSCHNEKSIHIDDDKSPGHLTKHEQVLVESQHINTPPQQQQSSKVCTIL